MRNKNNKYILLFIVLSSVFMLFPIFQEIYLTNIYGEDIPIIIKTNFKMIYGITIFLPHIAAALWLRSLAQKKIRSSAVVLFRSGRRPNFSRHFLSDKNKLQIGNTTRKSTRPGIDRSRFSLRVIAGRHSSVVK